MSSTVFYSFFVSHRKGRIGIDDIKQDMRVRAHETERHKNRKTIKKSNTSRTTTREEKKKRRSLKHSWSECWKKERLRRRFQVDDWIIHQTYESVRSIYWELIRDRINHILINRTANTSVKDFCFWWQRLLFLLVFYPSLLGFFLSAIILIDRTR